jgi:hypothetical protein
MFALKPFVETTWSVDAAGINHRTSQVTCAYEFSTRGLTCMLDSLVRVSRRAD